MGLLPDLASRVFTQLVIIMFDVPATNCEIIQFHQNHFHSTNLPIHNWIPSQNHHLRLKSSPQPPSPILTVGSRWSQHPRWTCVCWALWWLCSSCFGPSWEIALLPRTSWDVSDLPWVMDDHRFFHIKSVSFWRVFFPTLGKHILDMSIDVLQIAMATCELQWTGWSNRCCLGPSISSYNENGFRIRSKTRCTCAILFVYVCVSCVNFRDKCIYTRVVTIKGLWSLWVLLNDVGETTAHTQGDRG